VAFKSRVDQQMFEAILERSSDNIVITDGKGYILSASANFYRIYGIPFQEVIGKRVDELEKSAVLKPSVTLEVINQRREIQVMQTTTAGLHVMALGFPIFDEQGEIARVVSFSRDMTDFNLLQQEFEALQKSRVQELAVEHQEEVPHLVYRSKVLSEVVRLIRRISGSDLPILFLGESGVGKTELARFAHDQSRHKDGPFIDINCAAIPESIFESEIFGYEAGAFSGADRKGKEGVLEAARGGTLFLDEVGELPASLQTKLLKVLQDGEYRKLGSTKTYKADFRLICATNRDLMHMVDDGSFRLDLYFRINGFPVYVPALRERRSDIIVLVHSFINELNRQYNDTKYISDIALADLQHRDWLGNVRELKNTLERWYVISPGQSIDVAEQANNGLYKKKPSVEGNNSNRGVISSAEVNNSAGLNENDPAGQGLKELLEKYERKIIEQTLKQCKSSYELADKLKISQPSVIRRLQKYGLSTKV